MSQIYLGKPSQKLVEWCQENYPIGPTDPGPLCFTANEDGADVSFVTSDNSESWCHIQYSTDNKATWNTYSGQIVYLDSCVDKKVYFRADPENPNVDGFCKQGSQQSNVYHMFVINKSVAASGNIQYLLTSDGKRTDVPAYCYSSMFSVCTSLTQAPELPATTLATYCYNSMFYGCTSLTQAPELPATTLASSCYISMFSGCTSLTQAPELPATTLASKCYNSMFYGCTSLTQAPELPATTLATYCYSYMF